MIDLRNLAPLTALLEAIEQGKNISYVLKNGFTGRGIVLKSRQWVEFYADGDLTLTVETSDDVITSAKIVKQILEHFAIYNYHRVTTENSIAQTWAKRYDKR